MRLSDSLPKRNHSRQAVSLCALVVIALLGGCGRKAVDLGALNPFPATPGVDHSIYAERLLENPLLIPVQDHAFAWSQLTEELETYFRIRREDRVRVVDTVLTEGWIETLPTVGSSIFEPWKKDSTRGFERMQSTFQTIRRWARVRVVPAEGGYWFDVQVYKELEDLDHPQNSTVGSVIKRHDDSPERDDDQREFSSGSYGWIPIGRDTALEQRILDRMRSRLTQSDYSQPAKHQFLHRLFGESLEY